MKKILLLLFLLSFSVFATRDTIIASGQWNVSGTWADGTPPGTSDTVYKINNGTFNDTLDADYTIVAFICNASTAGTHWCNGRALTVTGQGTAYSDDGTGARNLGTGLNATGATSTVHFGSTLGTVTATSCAVVMSNTTLGTYDDDKGVPIFSLTIPNSGDSLLSTGSGVVTINSTGTALTVGSGASFTLNSSLNMRRSTTGNLYSIGATSVFDGSGIINSGSGAAGIVLSIPAIVYTGTGAWTIRDLAGSVGSTIQFTGTVDLGTRNLSIFNSLTNGLTIDFNDQNVKCGRLAVGNASGSDAYSTTINYGNGTFMVTSFNPVAASYTNTATVNFEGCKIVSSGDVAIPTKWTLNPGTSRIVTTGTCTFTLNGKAVYDIVDSLGALTFADAPTINNDFTILSGNSSATTWAGYTMTVGGDFIHDGTGTCNFGTGITMTGNSALLHVGASTGVITATSCNLIFSGSGVSTDFDKYIRFKNITNNAKSQLSIGGSYDSLRFNKMTVVDSGGFTGTTKKIVLDSIGDMEGSSGKLVFWSAANLFMPRDTVSYIMATNIVSNDTILATDGTSVDGGGNVNVVFPPGGPAIDSLVPSHGTTGDPIRVYITNGTPGLDTLKINGIKVLYNDSTAFYYTFAPALAPGSYPLTITDTAGNADTATWSYDTIPALVSNSPLSGNFRYSSLCTLTVTGGEAIDTITVGDSICSFVAAPTQVIVTIPANETARVASIISNSYGRYFDTLINAWSWVNGDTVPVISNSFPKYGLLAGGGVGAILGSSMTHVDSVYYGANVVAVDSSDETTAYVTIPAGDKGYVDIISIAHYGYRDTILSAYEYSNLHGVVLNPAYGDTAGGDLITVTADYGLDGGGMTLGGVDVTGWVVTDSANASGTTGARDKGIVSGVVYNDSGDSTIVSFRYGDVIGGAGSSPISVNSTITRFNFVPFYLP